jgi:hypothetical protein
MKRTFKEGLEKLVRTSKNIGKLITNNTTIGLIAFALPFIITNNVSALSDKLSILDKIDSGYDSQYFSFYHKSGALEGYDNYDTIYGLGPPPPSGIKAKIVSILEEETGQKELEIDSRPEESISTIDLEFSLHSQSGSPITISSMNVLMCALPRAGPPDFADFFPKPITYWERDANDPNLFYLVANVRKEILQNGGVIPLPGLNGTYGSEEPYLHAQIRFSDHFVHLNDDDTVDFEDYAIFANAFGRTDITDTNRADPTDLGAWADYDLDGKVDVNDLSIFTDYYLTGKKYHLEDGWILE